MLSQEIQKLPIADHLERFTATNSNFETERNYISLSHVTVSEEEIISLYLDGFHDTHEVRLRCYKGYQMERDLVARIRKVFPDLAQPGTEISAFDGLVKGHPDLDFYNFPADVKSVPLDEHLPDPNKIPKRAYWQIQGYMKYKGCNWGLLIYESRETGRIRHYWIRANASIQQQINSKLLRVVQTLGITTKAAS